MVTYFNKKDLVKFGEYLLSEERTNKIKEDYSEEDNISFEERLKTVYHADLKNFLESIRKIE